MARVACWDLKKKKRMVGTAQLGLSEAHIISRKRRVTGLLLPPPRPLRSPGGHGS